MVVRGDGDDVAANLYCGCVTFASRQAVVTLQTLVWSEGNYLDVKHEMI